MWARASCFTRVRPLAVFMEVNGGHGLAPHVHRQLRLQQGSAMALNAALVTAAALRWLPPIGMSPLHHGFALLLLGNRQIESVEATRGDTFTAMLQTADTPRRRRNAVSRNPRSEPA